MQLLNDYFALQKQIHEYFGYVEQWRVFPIVDDRKNFWALNRNKSLVLFAEEKEPLLNRDGNNVYQNEVYTQRHLDKWVYETKEHTMILVDTRTDLNVFLQVFSNDKRMYLDEESFF
jgi:hypothetical protein